MPQHNHSPATRLDSFHECRLNEVNAQRARNKQAPLDKFQAAALVQSIATGRQLEEMDFSFSEAVDLLHAGAVGTAGIKQSRCGQPR